MRARAAALLLALVACREKEPLPPAREVGSPALSRLLASPEHRRIAAIASSMRSHLAAGRCGEAAAQAPELRRAIEAAVGNTNVGLRELARRVQRDPNLRDGRYMEYKGKLLGLAVGIAAIPFAVKLGEGDEARRKNACESLERQLRVVEAP
jgi:hypothetical protein